MVKFFVRLFKSKMKSISYFIKDICKVFAKNATYIMAITFLALFVDVRTYKLILVFALSIFKIIEDLYYYFNIFNKYEKSDIPIPERRFTKELGDFIYIDRERQQELIIYMKDLEDWLELNKESR